MKVKMTSNYSILSDDPKIGDVLSVFDMVRHQDGFVDYFICEWNGGHIDVYPYECEEVQ